MLNLLFQLKQHNVISDGDYYFAKLIADKQLASAYPEHVQNLAVLLAALCSHSYQQGNTCLYLDDSLIHNLFGLAYRGLADERNYLSEIQRKIDYLSISEWQRVLEQHIAFTVQPLTDMRPLVFQHGALYFYRVWQDEFRVANYLKSAVEKSHVLTPEWTNEQIKTVLNSYFDEPKEYINWQKIAVATALRQPFCLISGGPGTGKTYTVARLLTVIQQLRFMCDQPPLQIALAAPTGKAAARLTESIGNALNDMSLSAELIPFVPTESVTLHRLLGMRLFDERSKFNAHNPLPVDLLVVDEASMVDLSMLAKLLQALKPQTKLILLGDKDQLASVEAGAVIGELGQFMRQDYSPDLVSYLTATTNENLLSSVQGNPIRDYLCYLHESRRFHKHSGIGHLAQAVNQADANVSWQLFAEYPDIECVEFKPEPEQDMKGYRADCVAQVLQSAVENYADFLHYIQSLSAQNAQLEDNILAEVFAKFNSVRFLTALRTGEFGVEQLNQSIAEKLRQKGLLQFKHSRDWYLGKPVMVNRNDNNVGLFNGDIGIYLGNRRVWFETGDGYKSVSISRVPSHETAFVMTVHKSQGSEFPHTFLVLPTENSPILSKELIYTALTRAKKQLTVFTAENIWKSAVRNPIKRQSGLGNLLSINNRA